jgi:hypothetical protein
VARSEWLDALDLFALAGHQGLHTMREVALVEQG